MAENLANVTMVNVHDAKTHLSRLLEQVEAGGRVTIARAGRPVADLVPHRAKEITFGTLTLDYSTEDFLSADDDVADLMGAR